MDFHTEHNHGPVGGLGLPNLILFVLTGLFHGLQAFSPDDIYTWTFRILTLISLSLVIYINWDKAVQVFKTKHNKNDKSGKAPADH